MEKNDIISFPGKEPHQEVDITNKLTLDDINKIEKYRQTRKTSVLTILFTDIVGYTAFTYQAGEVVSGKFRHIHDEIIISLVKKDGHGEIIKQIGDSFLIVFSDPTLAVKCALKLQELFRINADILTHKNYRQKIRIGLHMGQVSVEDRIVPDIFGTHVNLASRVMSLAKGDQVIVSGSVWENASGWLKDDQEIKVLSVYYGKIKLKGIGKSTEIYEFYTDKTGKIGIPGPILKRKQQIRMIWSALIALLIIIIAVPAIYIFKQTSNDDVVNIENRKEKIFLADILSTDDGSDDDPSNPKVLEEKMANLLQAVESQVIEKINENYYSLLKTNFISDYIIETEADLRSEYAKKGSTVPKGGQLNKVLSDSWRTIRTVTEVRPHLFKYKEGRMYYLEVRCSLTDYLVTNYPGKESIFNGVSCTNTLFTKVLMDVDSVPYFINRETRQRLYDHKKSRYSKGEIIKINEDDVVIKFKVDGNLQKPIPELIYTAHRTYKPWTNINDSGVKRRLADLDKLIRFYGTIDEWIKNIDTSDYNSWSYSEYRDLRNPKRVFGGETQASWSIPVELKLIEVYDSTALAKIQHKDYPWVELEVGDRVELE